MIDEYADQREFAASYVLRQTGLPLEAFPVHLSLYCHVKSPPPPGQPFSDPLARSRLCNLATFDFVASMRSAHEPVTSMESVLVWPGLARSRTFRIVFGILVLAHLALISIELTTGTRMRVASGRPGASRRGPSAFFAFEVDSRSDLGSLRGRHGRRGGSCFRTRLADTHHGRLALPRGGVSLYHRNISSNCGPDQLMMITAFFMMLSPRRRAVAGLARSSGGAGHDRRAADRSLGPAADSAPALLDLLARPRSGATARGGSRALASISSSSTTKLASRIWSGWRIIPSSSAR